jgi:hypothetical protein
MQHTPLQNNSDMKKLLLMFMSMLVAPSSHGQSISPAGIYGAANSSSAGGIAVSWVLGTMTPQALSALPVKLIHFAGTLTSTGNAQLDWETAEEYDNAGFEVQKSLDGKKFEALGWVDGGGDSK